MKKLFRSYGFGAILFLLIANLVPLLTIAQDNGGSSSTTTTTSTSKVTETAWYMSPWAWVAGAAVFILLLVALLRGSGNSSNTDRVTVTKTTTDV